MSACQKLRERTRPEAGMTANSIKNTLLAYYRFKLGYPYAVTEFHDDDVVVSNGKFLTSIEIKISWHDFRKEWLKKKYQPNFRPHGLYKPNRIFFAAPCMLAKRIADDLEKQARGCGVLPISGTNEACGVEIIRNPGFLHKEMAPDKILCDMVKRMSSELVTLRRLARPL